MCGSPQKARERERERNSPGGLVFSLFITIVLPLIPQCAIASVNCNSYSSVPRDTGDAWGAVAVIRAGNQQWEWDGNEKCKARGIYEKKECYISSSTEKVFANLCGSGCIKHVERYGDCDQEKYAIVYGYKRDCKPADFPYKIAFDGEPSKTVFGRMFDENSVANGKAYFGGALQSTEQTYCPNPYSIGGDGVFCHFKGYVSDNQKDPVRDFYNGAYAWDTSNCKYEIADHAYDGDDYHCTKGKIEWPAEDLSGGNAAMGFYLDFKTSKATYKCNQGTNVRDNCRKGWQKSNISSNKCDNCLTNLHWTCPDMGDGECVRGYKEVGTWPSSTCEKKGRYICQGENNNTCYCPSGFDIQNPGADNEICGPTGNECKANFNKVGEGEAMTCVCELPFVLQENDPDNPEDDTCDFKSNQIYTDDTGTFTLIEPEPTTCTSNP